VAEYSFEVTAAAITASTSTSQTDFPLPADAPRFARLRRVVIGVATSTSVQTAVTELAVNTTASLAPGAAMLKLASGAFVNNVLWFGDTVQVGSRVTVDGDLAGSATQPAAAFTGAQRR
jgi:hypothetical protein